MAAAGTLAITVDDPYGAPTASARATARLGDLARLDLGKSYKFNLLVTLSQDYVRTAFAITAYFCKGDFRERREALDEADGESLDYYCVTSADERHAIECEVYDGDDDVMCTLIEDTRLIDELWPAS